MKIDFRKQINLHPISYYCFACCFDFIFVWTRDRDRPSVKLPQQGNRQHLVEPQALCSYLRLQTLERNESYNKAKLSLHQRW
jgi:hypothetical protein